MIRPDDRQQELLDRVVEEFTGRLRQGERPAIDEFARRHPTMKTEIEELLTSVAMIEELKTQSATNANSLKLQMKEILRLDRIGDYKIIRELGRGGMGVVFEAVHESLGRRVAIKVMPNRTFDDEKYLERFKREAQAAANLHHTNIVSVFGMGQAGDHHYYVMEFVDGECLSDILTRIKGVSDAATQHIKGAETVSHHQATDTAANGRPDVDKPSDLPVSQSRTLFDSPKQRYRWAAGIGLQIADGLSYAHALGMLHRDIKPSNVLVDKFETVWLTDFGLVKNTRSSSITKTGDIIGTPQYMAPEAFEGRYDERSETYCLGLTLYEMVTLQPAYENASTPELLRRITTTSPIPARKINRRIPRDLNIIIQKSISGEPSYRYQTAADMRADLTAFLEDRPISARHVSMTENIWRWSKRNPLPASLTIATGLMICMVAIIATIALSISNRALMKSEEQKTSLSVAKREALFARDKANANIEFTVGLFDKMFRGLVLKSEARDNDLELDGFNELTGISTTVNEADADFLEQMLDVFMRFAEQNKDNLKFRTLAAKSFRRVANIYHLTAEYEKADEAYKRSIQIYEEIRKESPRNIPLALAVARTLKERGQVLRLLGTVRDNQAATRQLQQAAELLQNHPHSEKPEIRFELAKTLILIGAPKIWPKPELPERFESIFRSERFRPNAFRIRQRGANEVVRVGRPAESREAIDHAIAIADSLIDDEPLNADFQLLKANVLTQRAALLWATNRPRESKRALDEAIGMTRNLESNNPESPEYKFVLAKIHAMPVRTSRKNAIQSLMNSKTLLIGLAAKYDRNLDYRQLLANVSYRLARLQEESGDQRNAERNLKFANQSYLEMIQDTPRSRQIHFQAMSCLLQLVDMRIRKNKPEQAIADLDNWVRQLEMIQLTEKKKNRVPPSFFMMRVVGYDALAVVLRDEGRTSEARQAKAKAQNARSVAASRLARSRDQKEINRKTASGKSAVSPD